MIRAEPPVAIVITSFGSIVGRVVRKEPLESLYQIEDSGGIAIPFTIADLRRSKACSIPATPDSCWDGVGRHGCQRPVPVPSH